MLVSKIVFFHLKLKKMIARREMGAGRIGEVKIGSTLNFSLSTIPGLAV